MPTIVYTGSFGGKTAGADGKSTTLRGDALPSGAYINSIKYEIDISADKFSSSKKWCLHDFYLENGSPEADYNEKYMSGPSGTLSGYMEFSQSDGSVFDGSVTLFAKANTTHSSTSYMHDVKITIDYVMNFDLPTISASSPSVVAGEVSTVSFSGSNLSSMYHKVTWSIGSKSYTSPNTAYGATSASYTIPQRWIEEIKSSTTGTLSITISTYSSSGLIGTTSANTSLIVPENIVPTITGIDAERINGNVSSSMNAYVQGYSGIKLTPVGATGTYGSTISSYVYSGSASGTQNAASPSLTVSRIDSSGTLIFTVCAVDSRGRYSSPVSVSIDVIPYELPRITSATAERSLANGTLNGEGTYINVKIDGSFSSLAGDGNLSIKCYYQKIGESFWTAGVSSMEFGETYTIGAGKIDPNYSYQVKYVLNDSIGTTERIVSVGTASYIVFYRTDGTGVGIGKVCERDHAFEINSDWTMYLGDTNISDILVQMAGMQIPNIVYTTGSEPSNPVEGMIWLKKK